jgi:anti-sigma regulatory factor (Ser/Thr protein kinase)
MMTEISLNVLDVAENSVRANATLIEISIEADTQQDKLKVIIKDNGCGMTEEQIAHVEDPFFTTRTTRKVGLGIPFYKYAALSTGGQFFIESTLGVGTIVTAVFCISHIDRMPLGDMISTMHALITLNAQIDFIYNYRINDRNFSLDTREFREILGDVPFHIPEVSSYIREFLIENTNEVDNGFLL